MGLAAKLIPKYEGYLPWEGEKRREIIDGQVYDISPTKKKNFKIRRNDETNHLGDSGTH